MMFWVVWETSLTFAHLWVPNDRQGKVLINFTTCRHSEFSHDMPTTFEEAECNRCNLRRTSMTSHFGRKPLSPTQQLPESLGASASTTGERMAETELRQPCGEEPPWLGGGGMTLLEVHQNVLGWYERKHLASFDTSEFHKGWMSGRLVPVFQSHKNTFKILTSTTFCEYYILY